MENRAHVANYAATMARELRKMCRQVELNDLAYLFEVVAVEAAQARAMSGSAQPAGSPAVSHG